MSANITQQGTYGKGLEVTIALLSLSTSLPSDDNLPNDAPYNIV